MFSTISPQTLKIKQNCPVNGIENITGTQINVQLVGSYIDLCFQSAQNLSEKHQINFILADTKLKLMYVECMWSKSFTISGCTMVSMHLY